MAVGVPGFLGALPILTCRGRPWAEMEGIKINVLADAFPGKNQVNIFVKINRPGFDFPQLAAQRPSVFTRCFNDLLKGVLFLAGKLCPALSKLGGRGPTDACFPQKRK